MSNRRPLAYDRVNLFGPTPINLLAEGDTELLVLNDEDTKFFPTSIVIETAYKRGTISQAPAVRVDNGTDNQWLTAALTITAVEDTFNNLVLSANAPVITGTRSLRLKKTTQGFGQATSTYARTSGVATIVTAAAHGFTTGDQITITNMDDISFEVTDAIVTVVNSTTFTYEKAGPNVATTLDTGGRVGAILVNAYVVGIYY